jgi:hypothetical protein
LTNIVEAMVNAIMAVAMTANEVCASFRKHKKPGRPTLNGKTRR